MKTKIVVIYHSSFGHTKKVAEHISHGAGAVEGIHAEFISVEELSLQHPDQNLIEHNWQKLDDAQAIIFGSPTYMGSVSAKFKQFMDDTSKRWKSQRWKDKVAAGFTNSGSYSGDKLSALIQLVIFASQHSMIWIGSDIHPNSPNPNSAEPYNDKNILNRLGSSLGVMTKSEDASPELTPPANDLATAEYLGRRVAEFAKKISI